MEKLQQNFMFISDLEWIENETGNERCRRDSKSGKPASASGKLSSPM